MNNIQLRSLSETPAYKAVESLGVYNITSERQSKNGTLALYDPKTTSTYTFHANGYFRRDVGYGRVYQLNPTVDIKFKKGKQATRRILFPGDYQGMLVRSVSKIMNFRDHMGV